MQNKKIYRQIIAVAFWVTAWFIIALIVDNKVLVASPFGTVLALSKLMAQSSFYLSVAGSLLRIMCGFFAGIVLAFVLAVLAYKNEFAAAVFSPFVNLCKALPVAAFAVILIIWYGPSNLAFLISMIVVLPVMYFNMLEGLKNTDKKLLEMAKVLEVPLRNKLMFIYRPALRPYIFSAVKSGIGMSWKAGVAAEVIGLTNRSIGGQLYNSKVYFETAEVFAWAAVTIILSFTCEKVVLVIVRKLLDAKVSCSKRVGRTTGNGNVVIEKLSKSYGDNTIYKDFYQKYNTGETYVISQKSGSGKTTLLSMIAGLVDPDEGTIGTDGSVRMVFQEDRLCEDYSAVTNVAMTGIGEEAARKELLEVLDEDSIDKPCRELSGGMKRRVAIVRGMSCPGDIILLDEPYTGMDEQTIEHVKRYIDSRKQTKTVIVATHIL